MGEAADVMRRELAAFDAQDWNEVMAVFSPDCKAEVPAAHLVGADQVLALFSALWEAFPDMRVTATNEVEDGQVVAVQARATGTHRGTLRTPGGDIPPTGRRVDFPVAEYCEVRGGQIASLRVVFDRLTLLEQLGVAPAPTPA